MKGWDECDTWTQALILAYNQVKQHDELEEKINLTGGRQKPKKAPKR